MDHGTKGDDSMSQQTAETAQHLQVSRRGIVHVTRTLDDNASTLCGKGSRDLVYIGAVGIGERMCRVCGLSTPPR